MLKKLLRIKFIAIILVFSLVTPSLAKTDFWQEADITFWQTLPFATLWGHLIERQFSALMFPGAAVHWNAVVAFATVVSAGNAIIHARRVVKKDKVD